MQQLRIGNAQNTGGNRLLIAMLVLLGGLALGRAAQAVLRRLNI